MTSEPCKHRKIKRAWTRDAWCCTECNHEFVPNPDPGPEPEEPRPAPMRHEEDALPYYLAAPLAGEAEFEAELLSLPEDSIARRWGTALLNESRRPKPKPEECDHPRARVVADGMGFCAECGVVWPQDRPVDIDQVEVDWQAILGARVQPKPEPRCADCRWFERWNEGETGSCRRMPPQNHRWVGLSENEWCGEFQSRVPS